MEQIPKSEPCCRDGWDCWHFNHGECDKGHSYQKHREKLAMEQTNHTAEEEVKKWERYCYIKEYQFCTPNGSTATDGNVYEFTPKELDQYKKAVGQSYHTQRLKEIKGEVDQEAQWAKENIPHEELEKDIEWDRGYRRAMEHVSTLLQNHIDDE